nr:MAG TPA: hypothetical protein [Caudoviricetes sp.]
MPFHNREVPVKTILYNIFFKLLIFLTCKWWK